jgi:hypothetical protein
MGSDVADVLLEFASSAYTIICKPRFVFLLAALFSQIEFARNWKDSLLGGAILRTSAESVLASARSFSARMLKEAVVGALPGGPSVRIATSAGIRVSGMSIWVDDVDAAYQHCMSQGLDVTWPPTDMPWNVREMHVRHPDGHVFRISQARG